MRYVLFIKMSRKENFESYFNPIQTGGGGGGGGAESACADFER